MKIWMLVNSLSIVVILIIVYVVIRQLGVALNYLGPGGARGTTQGPRNGENISYFTAELEIDSFHLQPILYIFASESCAICKSLRIGAENLAKSWNKHAHLVVIYEGSDTKATAKDGEFKNLSVRHDDELRTKLGVDFVPFAVVTDVSGVVVGKGLVNAISHLESLLELLKIDRLTSQLQSKIEI